MMNCNGLHPMGKGSEMMQTCLFETTTPFAVFVGSLTEFYAKAYFVHATGRCLAHLDGWGV